MLERDLFSAPEGNFERFCISEKRKKIRVSIKSYFWNVTSSVEIVDLESQE